MDAFIIKTINSDIESELNNIGFDKTYVKKGVEKFYYKNFKIFDLTLPQANILKQTAISVGADCAVHRETITCKIEKTDCLLGGSISQLLKISQKLRKQPFRLAKLADLIEKTLTSKFTPIKLKDKVFDFKRPYIVGILNLTPDSFSDGGEFLDFEAAKSHLAQMVDDGADIIDIGAESTKPYSTSVEAETQLNRIIPILDFIRQNNIKIPISIDTRSSIVAKTCIEHGADIINDVSGGDFDSEMLNVVAEFNVPIIIQHSKGIPENMQMNPVYENLIDEIYIKLKEKTNKAISIGVKPSNIIVDPGIGFGKTKEQNLEIVNRADEFFSLSYPVMLGVSRKSFFGMQGATNEEKDIYTLAVNSTLLDKNINFVRVHNVKLHKNLFNLKGIKH